MPVYYDCGLSISNLRIFIFYFKGKNRKGRRPGEAGFSFHVKSEMTQCFSPGDIYKEK